MTLKTTSLLTDPHPKSHIVFPYTDEIAIAEAVGIFASAGLVRNETVLLVITPPHWHAVEERLLADSFDVQQLKADGQLVVADADDMLAKLVSNGVVESSRFQQVIGNMIATAKMENPAGRVRVFGEMVSLLFGKNLPAAARLEELWNALIDIYSIPLLCTYALDGPEHRAVFPECLMAAHTDALV
jgi:hypothetical protein